MTEYMDTDPAAEQQGDSKKISFRFCRECSNMLYPKEDPSSNMLMFACRSCQYSEPATAACIYRNALQEQIAETAGNVEDVAQDPTVSDSAHNHHHHHHHAADSFMQDGHGHADADADDDDGDEIPEMCTLCGQEILCPFCGQPSDGHLALEVDDPDHAQNGQQEEELVQAEQRERAVSNAGAS
ncbi:hypothetical protein Q7P37_007811 [Cladosporium fusiforme]